MPADTVRRMTSEIANRVHDLLALTPERWSPTVPACEEKHLYSMVDYTNLATDLTPSSGSELVQAALRAPVPPAAICTHPHVISGLKEELMRVNPSVNACSVTSSFPRGDVTPEAIATEVAEVVQAGADEVDIVAPYLGLKSNPSMQLISEVTQAAESSRGDAILKVIIESGEIHDLDLVYQASFAAANAGADFVKTSTGKTSVGATREHVAAIALGISDSGKQVGVKASGGVSDPAFALDLLHIVVTELGPLYDDQALFRIGSSSFGNPSSGTY